MTLFFNEKENHIVSAWNWESEVHVDNRHPLFGKPESAYCDAKGTIALSVREMLTDIFEKEHYDDSELLSVNLELQRLVYDTIEPLLRKSVEYRKRKLEGNAE